MGVPRSSIIGALVLVVFMLATACGGGGSKSPAPAAPTPTTWQLQGTVSESGASKRLTNVRVEVLDGANVGKFALTDSNGAYRLTGLSAGGFSVKAYGQGYVPSTQAVTLAADATMDFTLVQDVPILFASFSPNPISISTTIDPEYPNRVSFTLTVQESNYVPVTLQALYYRLTPTSGAESIYWTCDKAWLTENFQLEVPGGSAKSVRMGLVYNGPQEPGTLTVIVEVNDAKGQLYRVQASAAVEKPKTLYEIGQLAGMDTGVPVKSTVR